MSREPVLYRITTFFRKRPDITEEEFYDHWGKIHGPLCVPWALHHGIIEYTQYQTPSQLRQILAGGSDDSFKSSNDFDAAADFYCQNYEQYLNAFKDPYYLNVISKDEDNFVDKGQVDGREGKATMVRAISTMGYNRSIIKDGQAKVEVGQEILDVFDKWKSSSNTSRI